MSMAQTDLAFSFGGDHRPVLRGHARRARARVLLFGLMGVAVLLSANLSNAVAQDIATARAASIVQPQAFVSLQPVPRGRGFEIAVVAKITPGFHVNAHEPSEDYLIPTKVTAELPPGLVLVESSYPRGVMRGFSFAKTPLRVYEGSFTIRMKLRAAGSAPIGRRKIAITLGYQACNQDACLPPTKVPVTAQLEIAAADTPAQASKESVFSTAPAVKFPAHH